MRFRVTAKNAFGQTEVTSAQTGVVASGVPAPANTTPPSISGIARQGERLTAVDGTWVNSPTQFSHRWLRCDTSANGCGAIATGPSYRLVSNDISHTIRVEVTAKNAAGAGVAVSAPTPVVQPAQPSQPSGAIKLPSGEVSMPVDRVSPPQRLNISGVQFNPPRLSSRSAFTGRFRVTDTRGYVIRNALVYAIGLPYAWVRNASEAVTGTDGWATITFVPTVRMPLRNASVVFFVRARKPGDSLLTGVSTRRLVQVRVG